MTRRQAKVTASVLQIGNLSLDRINFELSTAKGSFRLAGGTAASTIIPAAFLQCLLIALALGTLLALFYRLNKRCSRSFAVTLALLPSVVCVVILMVNGNLEISCSIPETETETL